MRAVQLPQPAVDCFIDLGNANTSVVLRKNTWAIFGRVFPSNSVISSVRLQLFGRSSKVVFEEEVGLQWLPA